MKTYLYPQAITIPVNLPAIYRAVLLPLLLSLFCLAVNAQELSFKDPVLESGTANADGAVYRFSKVNSKVDALVTINGRSSSLVKLVNLDMKTTGHGKAFQPQVTYNNNSTPGGITDWWMEFKISFVNTGTNTPAVVDSFRITALDIDGNGDKINEWVSFYNIKSYLFEQTTQLVGTNIWELLGLVNTLVGRKFEGPRTNYTNIDTNATNVMVTNMYQNANEFRMRTGGHSVGPNSSADRMYSFWFRSFNYQAPQVFSLPLVLNEFSATLNNKKVNLNWVTGKEKALSHFVIERSVNGIDYSDAGIVIANGNSNVKIDYNFADAINTKASGVIYYRLKMVDQDGRFQHSPVRLIRIGEEKQNVTVAAYPNPVTSELRITIPTSWQNKTISFDLYNANGQLVKHIVSGKASQTEVLNVNELMSGAYIMKVVNGTETAVQKIVKR